MKEPDRGSREISSNWPGPFKQLVQKQRGVETRLSFLGKLVAKKLEVSATLRVSAIAIDFNRAARAFTRCAAILAVGLRGTATRRVLASIFLVGHKYLLGNGSWYWG